MDILIKSYNRPYYLDRCLQSLYLNCKGYNFTIKVLDDGTPDKYLNKIQKLYPEIIILKSEHHNVKSRFCEQGTKPENMIIPIDFWISSVSSATDYFKI
jgi:glycosyltransferase involved in cell wall biosynthesis